MITLKELGTDKSLLVVTHPQCEYCKEYSKSEYCQNIPLTKKIILLPKEETFYEIESLKSIYKAKDPALYFQSIMKNEQYLDIDYDKDVTSLWNENIDMLQKIEDKFAKVQFTPTMFLLSKENELLQEIVINVDFSKLMHDEIVKLAK